MRDSRAEPAPRPVPLRMLWSLSTTVSVAMICSTEDFFLDEHNDDPSQ